MSVKNTFEQLESNFNPEAARGLDLVFQFDIEDDKTYHLVIKDGTCSTKDPDCYPGIGFFIFQGVLFRIQRRAENCWRA